MTDKRKLYKEQNDPILNEDGTEKTIQQKIDELNQFILRVTKEMDEDDED